MLAPALLGLLVLQMPAAAEPPKPGAIADAVIAAFEAKDTKKLGVLASATEPDPWLVVEVLWSRDRAVEAQRYVMALPEERAASLGKQFGALGDDDKLVRARLEEARGLLKAKTPQALLDAFPGAVEGPPLLTLQIDHLRAQALLDTGEFAESEALFERTSKRAQEIGWFAQAGRSKHAAGFAAHKAGGTGRAGKIWRVAADYLEKAGQHAAFAKSLENLALLAKMGRRYEEASRIFEQARDAYERAEDQGGVADSWGSMGECAFYLGRYKDALTAMQKSVAILETLDDPAELGAALGNLAAATQMAGDPRGAVAVFERAAEVLRKTGEDAKVAKQLRNLGSVLRSLGQPARAERELAEALGIYRRLDNAKGIASVLTAMASLSTSRAEYVLALRQLREALAVFDQLEEPRGVAKCHGLIGGVLLEQGDYASAIEALERSIELGTKIRDRFMVASATNSLGLAYMRLGDYEPAEEHLTKAAAHFEAMGTLVTAAQSRQNLAIVYNRRGEHRRALEILEGVRAVYESKDARVEAASAIQSIASAHAKLKEYDEALKGFAEARDLFRQLGNRRKYAKAISDIASVHYERKNFSEGLKVINKVLEHASQLDSLEFYLRTLWGRAGFHLQLGDVDNALKDAREAVENLPYVLAGQSDRQGAIGRGVFATLFEIGAVAAIRKGSADEAIYFFESGRAGALLEAMGGRRALARGTPQTALHDEELEARTAVRAAAQALGRARAKGELAETKQAEAEVARLRRIHDAVLDRIDRETKKAAGVLYPKPDGADALRASLAPHEALVLYGLHSTDAGAVVVTTHAARLVNLGDPEAIRLAIDVLSLADPASRPEPRLEKLRELLIEPLGLGKEIARLVVAPNDELAYLPFGALETEREVVCVPSGTAYRTLHEERGLHGRGVLALGDPDYGAAPMQEAKMRFRSGHDLVPLPGTREEVRAIGSVVLLGKQATKKGFASALEKQERWRSVHLACHGLIDTEDPRLSSLALSPDADDHGFLAAGEIFRMHVPADLVVLSACETGRGRLVRGEGVMGLTRAFMVAGAPRVLVSLWRVDDRATSLLMRSFYERLREGKLSTAAALRAAQKHLRDHEERTVDAEASRKARRTVYATKRPYGHPSYWAAWVLWGLPD